MRNAKQNRASGADSVRGPSADSVPSEAASETSRRAPSLTRREQEVLELMAFGLTNKEIALRLRLGRRTVETHINHVLGKLDVSSRTRAVVEAGRAGLIGNAPSSAPGSPLESRPNNLPFQLTMLLGREQDLMDVKILLEGTRLLTLCGSGGVGKTRLALRVGVDLIGLYPHGVWFCDFSPISDAGLVASVVAHALTVREQQGRSLEEGIVSSLRRKHALLIFDNCEHVLEASAELADEILHNCPDVRILGTSRQALGIVGEVVHRVRSLTLPEDSVGLRADRAMRYGAVALFVDRALAADTRFTLTNENAPIVADICRRVDGIPLAIELAATRVGVVNVRSLAQSLDDRFRVLTGGSRTALPRHKTLSALIDWSYDLLSVQEQTFFDRLGIFAGSFSFEATEVVCAGDRLGDREIADLLIALVDKSLVVAQTGETQEHYRLLESTRAYALEKLRRKHEHEALARRHAQYFAGESQNADSRFGAGSTATWLANMDLDLENYRTALEWSLGSAHDPNLGAIIAGHLERLWALAGLSVEARRWLDLALEKVSEREHPALTARLWRAKARFLQGQPMRDCAERALALYETVGDTRGAAYVLRMLAFSLLQMGKLDEANEVIAKAISAFREKSDDVGVASCLSLQGLNAYNRHDFETGRALYSQALAAYRTLGDEAAIASALGNLAELEFASSHADEALRLVNESLIMRSRGKETTDLAIDLNNSAAYRLALGELDEARDSAREALSLAQPEQNSWNAAVALQHLACFATLRGHPRTGAQLVGYVNKRFSDLGLQRETTEEWGYKRLTAALEKELTASDVAALAEQGSQWTEDQATREALNI
jgi:predicted ATPase/DNA-binding CsgD family transcriptional regulator